MKKLLWVVLLFVAWDSHAQVFWTETFSNSCSSGCLASSYSGSNGAWAVVATGANSGSANKWYVSGAECGNAAGQCGTDCVSSDPSLHIGADILSIVDPGAAYYAGVASYWRAESPTVNCSGKSNITVAFNYIMEGEPGGDFATIAYYDGATWYYYNGSSWTTTFSTMPPSNNTSCAPQGLWTAYSVMLPASANNNPTVKIGFRWVNDADNIGTDPSFAVDDINISSAAGGCTASINPIFPAILCFGDCNSALSATATGAGPIQYSWNTVPVQSTATALNLCAGTYTVTITDSTGCTATASATITQPPLLVATISDLDFNGWDEPCNGDCQDILTVNTTGGTPPYAFIWSNGCNTPSCPNICAGTYTVIVTDGNGCTATASYTVTEPPVLTAAAAVDTFPGGWNVSCNGACDGIATINVSGGTPLYTYLWSNGCTGLTCGNLCAGTYTVTVTDVNGCTATLSFTLTGPLPLTIGAATVTDPSCLTCTDGSMCAGTVSGGTPPYSYLWTPAVSLTNCADSLGEGIYTVCITDANGCTACVTDTLHFPSGIYDNFSSEEITLSPNIISTSGVLTLSFAEHDMLFVIYDCLGKKVREEVFNGKQLIVEKGNLSDGLYFFKLAGNQRRFYSGKFIVE